MGLTVSYKLYTEDGTEMVEFPAHYEVCDRCGGHGSHVNPSIDGHGLGQEDFDEDPDFAEAYFAGRYDVACESCKGERVVAVEDAFETFTDEQKATYKLLEDQWEQERADRQLERMERMMGA